MVGVDHPHRAGLASHDDRLRRAAAAEESHAPQQVAVGDAGGAEEHVLAGDEVLGGQHPGQIVAAIEGLRAFLGIRRGELGLNRAAHAADRGGGDDALGGSADACEHVGARFGSARRNRARDIAVGDQPDARTGLAGVGDQLVVTRPVEDAHGQVGDG